MRSRSSSTIRSRREELNAKIGEFKANAPEYLNVAGIAEINENIMRANELRKTVS